MQKSCSLRQDRSSDFAGREHLEEMYKQNRALLWGGGGRKEAVAEVGGLCLPPGRLLVGCPSVVGCLSSLFQTTTPV